MLLDDLNLTMPNEIGGIWMKHIRNILLLITIIFAFVMQAEVYQNMLWNFNGAYYSVINDILILNSNW